MEVRLDPEVYADLKLQLELNLEKIMYQYGSYVHCVRTSIIRKGVSAGELCAYLLALPAFDSIKLKLSLLSDIRAELEKATTINGIFNVLNSNYATFINYEIFQRIAHSKNEGMKHIPTQYDSHTFSFHTMGMKEAFILL